MRIVIIANCYIPTLLSFKDLTILEKLCPDKLVILGDFLDFPRRVTYQFIDSLKKDCYKFINRIVRSGCREIIYVAGDRDSIILEWRDVLDMFSTRTHMLKICSFHVESIRGIKIVMSHGHVQLNIALPEALSPDISDNKILIEAARRARRKEEIAGLRGILPRDSWWFIAHTNLLYVDKEYKIVHVGHLSERSKISGCGPIGSIISPSDSRGLVIIDDCTIKLVKFPELKIVSEYPLC
ncbi:MAG: hypothetical protein GXO26_03915 [Crenarchaeota archaeon]|nr:hypothetical protein [Thermoproteota archaeon]